MRFGDRTAFQEELQQVIIEAYRTAGSYHKLAAELKDWDRRKLAKIAGGADVALTFAEIHALDTYLVRRGRSLSALLAWPSLTQYLGQTDLVKFLIGVRASPARFGADYSDNNEDKKAPSPHTAARQNLEMSNWDVRSLAVMLRSINAVRTSIRFDIEDVLLRNEDEVAPLVSGPPDKLEAEFGRADWYRLIRSPHPIHSVVCIGSPRACNATEIMLADMFSIAPFCPSGCRGINLPFRFFWPQDECGRSPSSFVPEISDRSFKHSSRPKWGVYIQGETFDIGETSERWDGYGFIAAQRRESQVFVVIAGLTGPATYASASLVDGLSAELPAVDTSGRTPVLWAAVRATITRREMRRGDDRVVDNSVITHTGVWTHPSAVPAKS